MKLIICLYYGTFFACTALSIGCHHASDTSVKQPKISQQPKVFQQDMFVQTILYALHSKNDEPIMTLLPTVHDIEKYFPEVVILWDRNVLKG